MNRLIVPFALAAALVAGCSSTQYGEEPVPGHEVRAVLRPGTAPAEAAWPDHYRRGAVFVVENRTGAPVEALILEFTGKARPRELLEAAILDPPGRPSTILPAPHGEWPLRARLGDPGTVLLGDGESLRLRVTVDGKPGLCRVRISIPGVTEW